MDEDKSRISPKACDLDCSGKLDNKTDLHSTVANFLTHHRECPGVRVVEECLATP
jgi:hypothetical protein